jgi:DNA-binding MarR family transcriptional regulator
MTKAINILGAFSMVLNDEIRAAVNEALGTSGETGSAIIMLGANPGLTIAQVAHALGLTHSGCVRLIDRLEAEGLVARKPGVDQRSVALELTKAGRKKRIIALKQRERVLLKATARLSDGEVRDFEVIVDKLLRGLLTDRGDSYRFCRMCDEGTCVPFRCPVEERWAELFE